MPGLKGTYLLILHLDTDVAGLRVGRLGQFNFAAGYYLYIGSAFGSGGLEARLAYHRRRVKQHPHWHVDYLRECARLVEAWALGSEAPLECPLVRALEEIPELSVPVPRFGASDSACDSHLFYAPRRPSARALTGAVLAGAESLGRYGRQLTIDIHTYDEG
jgi:Uri superfamily endonuclease